MSGIYDELNKGVWAGPNKNYNKFEEIRTNVIIKLLRRPTMI